MMENNKVYCISYDLYRPNQEYEKLQELIKSLGTWWHQTGSVWFVKTYKNAIEIRDLTKPFIDNDDKLFVMELGKEWAGIGFSKEEYEWVRTNISI